MNENLLKITNRINQFPYFIAIDGRCAAGKTTLAAELQRELGCTVIHMDDFYLQPYQRTQERLQTPGENVDHERFLQEVMLPLTAGKATTYYTYDCHKQELTTPIHIEPTEVIITEGSYCCNKALWDYYHLHVFLDIEKSVQKERILRRNPDMAEQFLNRFIPMEEAYFDAFSLRERCELVLRFL